MNERGPGNGASLVVLQARRGTISQVTGHHAHGDREGGHAYETMSMATEVLGNG